jgi:hypothetical protein
MKLQHSFLAMAKLLAGAPDGILAQERLHLRGTPTTNNGVESAGTAKILDSSNPLADITRSGLDRSLSSIHESQLNLVLPQEQLGFLSEVISQYSRDGNDDGTLTCPFDDLYFEDEDIHGRILQMDGMDMDNGGHHDMHYGESSCNAMLSMATCVDWSTWIGTTNNADLSQEVKIPCGECVILNAGPDQELNGATLEFGAGINIVGKLEIPSDADITLVTKYVFVQGELVMPPPPDGSAGTTRSPVSSVDVGPKVKFTLYGTEDVMFKADNATDNAHLMMENISAKPFVVAGGRVDIRAIDHTCPSWVKLQSISYGTALPNVALGKNATQMTTYRNNIQNDGPSKAVDGNHQSFTHTECNGPSPWWEVDLAAMYTIASLKIVNRLDCCGGRLHDFDIKFLDESRNEVKLIQNPGQIGSMKTWDAGYVAARYVKVSLTDTDCLQLGEVEVYGYPEGDTMPSEGLDILTVGEDAARCWSSPGSRILLTSDTFQWDDSHTATVVEAGSSPGTIAVLVRLFKGF